VEPAEIRSVVNRYSRRWDIENQYKSIKSFMPKTSSTDYRLRFCNFALSTLIYNLWRLTDYLIKAALDEPIRSPPVITAKTFVRALGDFLREFG
jgi:IS4 transposase